MRERNHAVPEHPGKNNKNKPEMASALPQQLFSLRMRESIHTVGYQNWWQPTLFSNDYLINCLIMKALGGTLLVVPKASKIHVKKSLWGLLTKLANTLPRVCVCVWDVPASQAWCVRVKCREVWGRWGWGHKLIWVWDLSRLLPFFHSGPGPILSQSRDMWHHSSP